MFPNILIYLKNTFYILNNQNILEFRSAHNITNIWIRPIGIRIKTSSKFIIF